MPPRIVVVGGGFAGLNAIRELAPLAVRASCHLTLINDDPRFVFRPGLPGLALGRVRPDELTRELRATRPGRLVSELRVTPLEAVDADARRVLAGGRSIPYDVLILAVGSRPDAAAVPGCTRYGLGLWTVDDALRVRQRLRAGVRRLVVAGDHTSPCIYGLYELAFMVAGSGPRVDLVTTEAELGDVLGPAMRGVLAAAARRRGIHVHPGRAVAEVARSGVQLDDGTTLDADAVIISPPAAAPPALGSLPAGTTRAGLLVTRPSLASVRWNNIYGAGGIVAIAPPSTGRSAEQMGMIAARNAAVTAGLARRPLQDYLPDHATLLHLGRWYGVIQYRRRAPGFGPPRGRLWLAGWPLGMFKDLFRRAYLAWRL